MHKNSELAVVAAKVVDDIKIAGNGDIAKRIIDKFNNRFKLGTVSHVPGRLLFFGINTTENEEFTIDTNAGDKRNALPEYSLTRSRRKQPDELLNSFEKSFFASTNSSLGLIGSAASPFFVLFLIFASKGSRDQSLSFS